MNLIQETYLTDSLSANSSSSASSMTDHDLTSALESDAIFCSSASFMRATSS